MKARAEAVSLIKSQFDDWNSPSRPSALKKGCLFHYGKQELRELLDFIYEGEPQSEDEKIGPWGFGG
jgi:hypothetical protein